MFWVLGLVVYSFGTLLRGTSEGGRTGAAVDKALGIPYLIVILGSFVCWALFVVPAQYVIVLVSGAPARLAVRSRLRAVARISSNGLEVKDPPKADPIPTGWWDASFLR